MEGEQQAFALIYVPKLSVDSSVILAGMLSFCRRLKDLLFVVSPEALSIESG
jgi:hypothetical protein